MKEWKGMWPLNHRRLYMVLNGLMSWISSHAESIGNILLKISLLLFNHRQFNSVDNIKKNHQWNYKRSFFSIICPINWGIYKQNKMDKYFLFGVPFPSLNSSLNILPMELQTDQESPKKVFSMNNNRLWTWR